MKKITFPIVLYKQVAPCKTISQLIANKVLVKILDEDKDSLKFYLHYINSVLHLTVATDNKNLSLHIDFVTGKSRHRLKYGGGKNQALAKACGLDKHPKWWIFDATAGLGKDAFVLASLGSTVTLCEQHPALYGLLTDAMHRAQSDDATASIVERMQCANANSIEYLESLVDTPDVIYLDPMYPSRKKSAKIKKEMQILQQLVGHSGDDVTLCESALKIAKHRVVVKRPKSASPLIEKPPSYTVQSVNTRYDVYVR